jgi:hypothetical protein
MRQQQRTVHSNERGIAMLVTMFTVLLLSVLGSSMMFVARTEALSGLNYKTMSQTRYGAESGVHTATNHLLFTYIPPGTNAGDPLANYNTNVSPVLYNGNPVVLSSSPDTPSNYPVAAVQDAFSAASQGALSAGVGTVTYTASARLLSMRQITESITGQSATLQTWEITGQGTVPGAGSALVEVSAIVERQARPVYEYAAFAQDNGCDALKFGGGATTNSYDSRLYSGSGTPATDDFGGNVGTNGNLNELGNTTTIHGSLSTPRTGVGSCSNSNVTALTLSGDPTLDDGIIQLPQAITWPTPPLPNPLPPTTNAQFQKNSGCVGGLVAPICTGQAGVGATITPNASCACPNPPPIVLGDVSVTGGADLHLGAGTYIVNSLSFAGGSKIIVDSGPVIFQIVGAPNVSTPLDFTGGTAVNETYDPSNLQFIYGGTNNVKLTGGSAMAGLVYAPEASMSFAGSGDFYGAVIAKKVTDMGGAAIHYDRALETEGLTTGNFTMSSFSWRSF